MPRGMIHSPRNDVIFSGTASQLTFFKQKVWSLGGGEIHEWKRARPNARAALPLPLRRLPPAPHYPRRRSDTRTLSFIHPLPHTERARACVCVCLRVWVTSRLCVCQMLTCVPAVHSRMCVCVCARTQGRESPACNKRWLTRGAHTQNQRRLVFAQGARRSHTYGKRKSQMWAKLPLIWVLSCDRMDQLHAFATFALFVGGCVAPDGPQAADPPGFFMTSQPQFATKA